VRIVGNNRGSTPTMVPNVQSSTAFKDNMQDNERDRGLTAFYAGTQSGSPSKTLGLQSIAR